MSRRDAGERAEMAKEGKKSKAAGAVQLDFTNVKDGGNFNKKRQPAGDYKGTITKVEAVAKKGEDKITMWLFTIEVKSGKYPYYCNFKEANQLWKIRNIFIAAGVNVPKKRMNVDPNKIVGHDIGVTLEDDEYDGKTQSNISSVFPTSELEGDSPGGDDEESVEAPQGGKKGKKKGKKNKGQKVDDAELEELEIDEI